MRALTVRPGVADSPALTDLDEPTPAEGRVLVDGLQVGLCGTDEEIVAGEYGQAPPGSELLVLGHENLGRVADVEVLLEPTTIVAKAWEQLERIGRRAFWQPQVAVITGAGPVGLLAALLAVQRGLQVHVFDIVTSGSKPELVDALGATYHSETLPDSGIEADVTIECTGVPSVVVDVMTCNATDSVTCLTGVSSSGTRIPLDIGALSRNAVLQNDVVFGSVNANRRHYDAGMAALAAADRAWLSRLITRRVPVADFRDAFADRPDDVKVVLELATGPSS
jgi:threonine dehydrogenase-like Zn-dependent dehydrogenase